MRQKAHRAAAPPGAEGGVSRGGSADAARGGTPPLTSEGVPTRPAARGMRRTMKAMTV